MIYLIRSVLLCEKYYVYPFYKILAPGSCFIFSKGAGLFNGNDTFLLSQ